MPVGAASPARRRTSGVVSPTVPRLFRVGLLRLGPPGFLLGVLSVRGRPRLAGRPSARRAPAARLEELSGALLKLGANRLALSLVELSVFVLVVFLQKLASTVRAPTTRPLCLCRSGPQPHHPHENQCHRWHSHKIPFIPRKNVGRKGRRRHALASAPSPHVRLRIEPQQPERVSTIMRIFHGRQAAPSRSWPESTQVDASWWAQRSPIASLRDKIVGSSRCTKMHQRCHVL